jgi:hypothetical protein
MIFREYMVEYNYYVNIRQRVDRIESKRWVYSVLSGKRTEISRSFRQYGV